MVHNYQPW